MKELFIKGVADGLKGSCAFLVKGKDIMKKDFNEVIPTKGRDIPILLHRGQYQTELYALTWGISTIPAEEPVTVYTNSKVIESWINNRDVPEHYKPLFDIYLKFSEGRKIKAKQINIGQSRIMDKVRDTII